MLYKKLYQSRKFILLSLFALLIPNIVLPMQLSSGGGASGSSAFPVRQSAIDKIWADAPTSVKIWAEELQLQDESICDKPYRLFLYGVPGTGKTSLARGIAHQNPDWVCECIDASDCDSRYRGGTANNLRKKLKNVLTKQAREQVKIILIIDEVHTLLEKYGEEGSDSGRTSEVLRAFLDKQIEDDNKDLMIILTGNEVSDIKPSLRSRLQGYGIKILPPSPHKLYEIFTYYAENYSFEALDEENFYHIFELGDIKVGRDVVDFVKLLKRTISETGYRGSLNQYSVTFDFLEQVARSFKESNRDFGGDEQHVSQRAFQQQLQREAQEENRRLHKEAQEHAEKLSEKNTAHTEKLSNRGNVIQVSTPIGTFLAGYAVKKYMDTDNRGATTNTVEEASRPTLTATHNSSNTEQAQPGPSSRNSSNIASVVRTFGSDATGQSSEESSGSRTRVVRTFGSSATEQPSGRSSNIASVARVVGAGAATAAVVKVVASGAGAASVGGSAPAVVAGAGIAAKVAAVAKGLLALALAHPIVAGIGVLVSIVCCCCASHQTDSDDKED